MNKKNIIIGLNILLIVLEVIGLSITLKNMGFLETIMFYTELSNFLGLIASLVFVLFLFKGEIPKWVRLLKFISVLSLTVTFLVVIFVLGPMYDFNYKSLLFSGSMLYTHLLCPILAFILFVFLEGGKFSKKECLIANALTIGYSFVMIPLNLFKVVDGPYPFLRVRDQSIFMSIVWIILIMGGSYLLSLGIRRLKERY